MRVFDEVFPGLSGDPLSEQAGSHEHQVLVLKGLTKGLRRLEVAQPGEELLAGEVCAVPDGVVPRQARRVRNEIARRQAGGRDRVVHAEVGHVLDHRLVPLELAFVDEHAEDRRRERLAVRADGEERVAVRVETGFEISLAVALGEDELTVLHHSNAQARHEPVRHELFDPGVEALEGRLGVGARCPLRSCDEQKDEDDRQCRSPVEVRNDGTVSV